MSRTRSPNYPALDLGAAIDAVGPVFDKEKRNKMPRVVLASHLGYGGLNGRALGVIGALRAYGLVEGGGDEMRVSDDAIILLNAPNEAVERQEALERCAFRPTLFQDLRGRFQDVPSEAVLKYTLIKQGFTPEAAGKAVESYLATMTLVGSTVSPYNPPAQTQEKSLMVTQQEVTATPRPPRFYGGGSMETTFSEEPKVGTRKEVITLDEGDVVILFPENLSTESFADLEDHLKLFIRKMNRRAKVALPAPEDDSDADVDIES